MEEREASTAILQRLRDDSSLVDMLSKFHTSLGDMPMLILASILPKEWNVNSKTINLYTLSSTSRMEYNIYRFVAACRSNSYVESRDLANKVKEVLNRRGSDGWFSVVSVQQTINPQNAETDNYNTPVEIMVRTI